MTNPRRGLGRVYKRGNTWWIDYSFRGMRHRESSASTRRGEAVKLLRRRLEEMGRGRLIGPSAENVTLDDLTSLLLDDYRLNGKRSIERAEYSVRRLKEYFGGHAYALDLTTDRINRYVRARIESDGAKPATVQKELAALKRAFNLAVRAGLLDHVPYIPMPTVRNVREGFFERAEFDTVLAELPDYLRPPFRFGYLTGWRVKSEVLPMRWRQVDFGAGVVRLEPGTTKNDEGRTFPFSALPELEDVLREQRERTSALEKAGRTIIPWVFHRDGEQIKSYQNAWRKARKAAGLQDAIPHDMRRTAVRNLERAAVPRSVAMKLTGHKTEAVYLRYAIAAEADLREGVEKLANLFDTSDSRRKVAPIVGGSHEG